MANFHASGVPGTLSLSSWCSSSDPDHADLIIVPGAAGPISEPENGRKIGTIPILLARTMETLSKLRNIPLCGLGKLVERNSSLW